MREIQKDEVLSKLELMEFKGNHIDERLFRAVDKSENMFLITLKDSEYFLSLIWQEIDDSRLLTPKGESRILHDVAKRMLENYWTFEKLSSNLGLTKKQHNPKWFETCIEIDRDFDVDRFGWVTVVPANYNERNQSPKGKFYIYDGTHKTIVLSKRLLKKETEFQPIEALYILPRPLDD
jgi:hypothetical protein